MKATAVKTAAQAAALVEAVAMYLSGDGDSAALKVLEELAVTVVAPQQQLCSSSNSIVAASPVIQRAAATTGDNDEDEWQLTVLPPLNAGAFGAAAVTPSDEFEEQPRPEAALSMQQLRGAVNSLFL